MTARRPLLIAVVTVVLFNGGCVQRAEQEGALLYTFAWWAPTWLILAALLLLYFGVRWLFKKSWRWYFRAIGGIGVLLSLFLATVLLPTYYVDQLRLDDAHVAGRYGMWWSPKQYDVRFAQLAELDVTVVRSEHYKGPAPSYWLDLVYRDGRRESLPMGDLLQSAAHEIRARAMAAGVKVGELPHTL